MMAFCDRMYIQPSDAKVAAVDDLSTQNNIVLISYSILTQFKKFHESPPFCCRGCGAALCFYSKVLPKDAYEQKMAAEEFPEDLNDIKKAEEEDREKDSEFTKGQFFKNIKDDERVWICEFCDVHNKVPREIEVPETEDQLYLIKKGFNPIKPKQEEETKTSAEGGSNINFDDQTNVIFCIDISGSMSSMHETNHDGKKGQATRLKLISDAVLRQIETMKEIYPNRKVGLILFGSYVTLKGDCSQKEVIINSDLDNYGKLLNYSKLKGGNLLTKPLNESFPHLDSTVKKLQAGGGTALGPALLCGLGLAAQGKAGSKIILCTDGLANVGLGILENTNNLAASEEFYDRVGATAAENGVSISIITIQGNACRVDALGPLTDRTAGTITRVDPANFDLGQVASNNLVATKVVLKAILHEALSFQNEDNRNLRNGNSILMKDVGSVSEENEVYFEYRVKSNDELKKEKMNIENLEWIPLQSQISYRDLSGNEFVRIICKKQELTQDQNQVQQGMKAKVLAGFIEKEGANLVLKGKIGDAKKKNKQWSNLVNQAANQTGMSEENKKIFNAMQVDNEKMESLLVQTEAVQHSSNQAMKDDLHGQWYEKKQKKKK